MVSFDKRDRRALIKTNIEGTANVVNLCLEHNVKKLIHISSIAALGRHKQDGLTNETHKYEANKFNSLYSVTKYQSELEVWRGKEEGLKVIVLNPAIILGSGFWDIGSNGFFKHVWRGSSFYPTGTNGFVDVRDIARFIALHIENEYDHDQYLMVAESITYQHLLTEISHSLGKKAPSTATNKWILGLAWRLDKWRAVLTGSRPMLTQETAVTSMKNYHFDHSRSLMNGAFKYTPLNETIAATGEQFREAAKHQFQAMVLPF
jgi:nucleoside-diphosphate-sugar epimerase